MDSTKSKIADVKETKSHQTHQKGIALPAALIILAILMTIALTVLAVSSSEVRIAGSDLQRTQTFYATAAGIEKLTNDFSSLFRRKMNPTIADLDTIAADPPTELLSDGFTFQQQIREDAETLASMRATQGLDNTTYPHIIIPEGVYAGLTAGIVPYKITSTATHTNTQTQVKLEREFNNYLIPIFQFGVFSNEDVEIHPGPLMTFYGRIHSNGNIYALRNTRFLSRVTTAGEFVRDIWRSGRNNGGVDGSDNVYFSVNGYDVPSTLGNGSVLGGPNFPGAAPNQRGHNPGNPNGSANSSWESNSVLAANGSPNRFGGNLLTRTTGVSPLRLPLELGGNSPAEVIKRMMPADNDIVKYYRYHRKAQIRILIDDTASTGASGNIAGIPAGRGVNLDNFVPSVLGAPNTGNVLKRMSDLGTYLDSAIQQGSTTGPIAETVRRVKNSGSVNSPNGSRIPNGSGIQGHILIEIVKPDGTAIDVTQTILSMGVTEGEPNAIIHLQRPLWAAYVQGSRDRDSGGMDLVTLTNNGQTIADGEISNPVYDPTIGYLKGMTDDDAGALVRGDTPSGAHNQIVPINLYNVREGWYDSNLNEYKAYERGLTSVVQINMRNLARWVDGVYDANLLSGTQAVSANIEGAEGYVVYVSDRRGDRVKPERDPSNAAINTNNGCADNEDIYGADGILQAGEDVIDFGYDLGLGANKAGTLQKDTAELPDLGAQWSVANSGLVEKKNRADMMMQRNVTIFRRSVRLFNGERLAVTGVAPKLSETKGITVATENMVYIWGNYNTTGVSNIPVNGSTLNDGSYLGLQVPTSIVADSFFPLSRTWFDASSSLHPEGDSDGRGASQTSTTLREADANLVNVSDGTSVRAAIIAGTTLSALTSAPGRDATGQKISGGIVNYPRFLELWSAPGVERSWNFTGSFVPLYHSTQAVSQWENSTSIIYMPPRRNWSFDTTLREMKRLPPGTPFLQYVQSTAFRQKLRN